MSPRVMPPVGRVLVGVSLLIAWASLGRVLDVRGIPHPAGLSALVELAWLTTPAAAAIATVAYVGAVAVFVLPPRALPRAPEAAAAVILGLLALGSHVQACQWPGEAGVNGATILPGAALSAWLVVQLLGGPPEVRAWRGREAACGIVAAVYPLAALSKVLASGLEWASAGNLALHIASHSYAGLPALQPLRLAAAASPALCGALGVATLLLEGGALAFAFPAARRPLAAALAAMHVGIGLLMGLHHYECLFLVLGLALRHAPDPARAADERATAALSA